MKLSTTERNIYTVNYSMSNTFSKFLASFCSGAGTSSAQRHQPRLPVMFMVGGGIYEPVHILMKKVSDRSRTLVFLLAQIRLLVNMLFYSYSCLNVCLIKV